MFFTFNAILPVILTILVGYILKTTKLLQEQFFQQLNKLCFRCCLPVLLFYNVYNVNNLNQIISYYKVCIFVVIAIIIFYIIAFFFFMIAIKDTKQKGVMIQCAFRSNYAIIGISLAISMTGENSIQVVIASILSSISIPLFNVLAIISLSVFVNENNQKISIVSILKKIITNPLILGVASGFISLIIRQYIPRTPEGNLIFSIKNNLPFLYRTIQMLATCASTIALIALGGNFTFKAISKLKNKIIVGVLTRTIICPVICLTIAYLLGFKGPEFPALIALFGSPVAVSSVPMTKEMGNDDELAGQLVVWTSIASAFTLFFIIYTSRQFGIL
ncbi:MAG: AEC family transporter [Treponema sp.]|nr:AEC family transporter [Treponema sp.]